MLVHRNQSENYSCYGCQQCQRRKILGRDRLVYRGISHGHDVKGPDRASVSRGMPWVANKLLEARGEPQADFFFLRSSIPAD